MSYRFVKIKNKTTEDMGTWYFVPDSLDQITEHTNKYLKPRMQNGFNLCSSNAIQAIWKYGDVELRNHCTDEIEGAIEVITNARGYKLTPLAAFETANNMLLETFQQRQRQFIEGKPLYLANGVQNFGYTPVLYNIVEEFESEKFEYPDERKFDPSDARYMQWDGGIHWYAKVGYDDVVDENGNQKWSTHEEAEKAVEWYCQFYEK